MDVTFNNGTVLNVSTVTENKLIYAAPKKWELRITSDTDISSNALDELLTEENIKTIRHTKADGDTSVFSGYSTVDTVKKTYNAQGVSLIIVLKKEDTSNDESEV